MTTLFSNELVVFGFDSLDEGNSKEVQKPVLGSPVGGRPKNNSSFSYGKWKGWLWITCIAERATVEPDKPSALGDLSQHVLRFLSSLRKMSQNRFSEHLRTTHTHTQTPDGGTKKGALLQLVPCFCCACDAHLNHLPGEGSPVNRTYSKGVPL